MQPQFQQTCVLRSAGFLTKVKKGLFGARDSALDTAVSILNALTLRDKFALAFCAYETSEDLPGGDASLSSDFSAV